MLKITPVLALLLTTPCFAQLASYSAGLPGNPAIAPDPVTQGWTLVDPSGGQVGLMPVSPDGGLQRNAWQIEDGVTFNGGRAHYAALFSPAQNASLAASGWEITFDVRLLVANGNNVFFEYAAGTGAADDRYLIFLTISGTDVIANALLSNVSYVCPAGNDGTYHTYTIRKMAGAGNLDAELLYDGVVLGPVPREDSNGNAPDGGVHWGSGSSAAKATMNVHSVAFGELTGTPIGSNYCTATLNSTGAAGSISAVGSRAVVDNDVTLQVQGLPPATFGIFLVSRIQAQTPLVDGFLCLGGTIGRYSRPGEIYQVDAAGRASHVIDLTEIPQASMSVPVLSGETWNFQGWHRDFVGGSTSANLTNGLEIDFL